ncbi:MAG: N-acetylglucosamine kinase [Candidatus Acidiferrales bacterium]
MKPRGKIPYWLGFDGGGTKTDCVILDSHGEIVGEGRGGPANPVRAGFDAAFRSLGDAAGEALKAAHLRSGDVTGVCAGLAGAGQRGVIRRVTVFLVHEFPHATAQVTTDLEAALEAAVGAGAGIVLIAGTGSAAYGRNSVGETARAGGYGPWIGDEGSAYEIGRQAIAAVARTRDLGAPVTLLAEMVPAALQCPDWDELLQRIARSADNVFPKLFPAVAEAANSDDSAAMEILFGAAIGLGNLAMTVVRRLGLKDEQFPLVKCGGVFGESRKLDDLLDSILRSGAARATITRLEISPAVGAARIAARTAESPAHVKEHGA